METAITKITLLLPQQNKISIMFTLLYVLKTLLICKHCHFSHTKVENYFKWDRDSYYSVSCVILMLFS